MSVNETTSTLPLLLLPMNILVSNTKKKASQQNSNNNYQKNTGKNNSVEDLSLCAFDSHCCIKIFVKVQISNKNLYKRI